MARIRSIKPEALQHRHIGPLSDRALRLWLGLITQADDEGRLVADPAWLRVVVFGYHPTVTIEDVEAALSEMVVVNVVQLYTVDGVRYLAFPSWRDHQRIDHPRPSRLPPPPALALSSRGVVDRPGAREASPGPRAPAIDPRPALREASSSPREPALDPVPGPREPSANPRAPWGETLPGPREASPNALHGSEGIGSDRTGSEVSRSGPSIEEGSPNARGQVTDGRGDARVSSPSSREASPNPREPDDGGPPRPREASRKALHGSEGSDRKGSDRIGGDLTGSELSRSAPPLDASAETVHPPEAFDSDPARTDPHGRRPGAARATQPIEAASLPAGNSEARSQAGAQPGPGRPVTFRMPVSIAEALDRAPVLGAVERLREPAWWQAQVRANPGVDFAAEVLRAEAWLRSNPGRAPKSHHARFLHAWLARADRPREEG